MKPEILERVIKHGEILNCIFNTNYEPVKLCRKLRRLEIRLNKEYENYCNIPNYSPKEVELETDKELLKLFGEKWHKIGEFNDDPRGYSIKIKDSWARANYKEHPIYRDMGGYGIIAPDLSLNY